MQFSDSCKRSKSFFFLCWRTGIVDLWPSLLTTKRFLLLQPTKFTKNHELVLTRSITPSLRKRKPRSPGPSLPTPGCCPGEPGPWSMGPCRVPVVGPLMVTRAHRGKTEVLIPAEASTWAVSGESGKHTPGRLSRELCSQNAFFPKLEFHFV